MSNKTFFYLLGSAMAFILALGTTIAWAGSVTYSSQQGESRVYYSVVNTSFLNPQVAKQHKVVRSKSQALIHVSVQKKNDQGAFLPTSAIIQGHRAYNSQQRQPINFREIRKGNKTIYYISDFPFQDAQQLNFQLSVQPDPNQPAFALNFYKQLFVN
jgi:hypothetical protein